MIKGHKKGAHGHNLKKGGQHHSGYHRKKANEYHHDDGWKDNGWNHKSNHNNDAYDWRFK